MSSAHRFRACPRLWLLGALLLLGAGCTKVQGNDSDPFEGVNRGVFAFNRSVDTMVFRPAVIVYQEAVPWPFRDRIADFLSYLKTPVILVNDLLQGDPGRAEITFRRFFINSIAGLGGLIDIASHIGIAQHSEDFGQTLAIWGIEDSPYLVLPLLGPSSVRDAVGLAVDYTIDPVAAYLLHTGQSELQWARMGFTSINTRQRGLKITDNLEQDAVDLYAKVRSLYRQYRAAESRNGALPQTPGDGEPAYPGQEMNLSDRSLP